MTGGGQVWLVESLSCGGGECWTFVEVSECVVVFRVAKWAWLVDVSKSVVGGPSVQPCLNDGDGCARFACCSDLV